MTVYIKKYSAILATAVLASAFFAAPYLVPATPDSPIFRAGSLTALLLLACFSPIRHALMHHSLRTLLYGGVFGLVLSVCLSLGAELLEYSALLPGMGSLVRRLAIPFMMAPFTGILISYLFVHLPPPCKRKHQPIPFAAFFLLFSLCYGAILLALYPGVLSYDFAHEIDQFTKGYFYAAHPVFHTLFLGSLFSLGETLFGSMTAGAALYHTVQLLLLSALFAWACTFIQRRVPYRSVVLILAAGFAFLPFHGVLAVSTAKDPLFAGLCTMLCLLLWEIAENPTAFLSGYLRPLRFALCCLGISLLRHNGVFAYAPACIALLLLCRNRYKKALCVIFMSILLTVCIPKGLESAVNAKRIPSTELMSVPCQQLMRTARYGDLPEDEFIQVERWFPNATHTYKSHFADPAKGGNFNSNRYRKDPMDFWTTYAKYGLKYPRIYLEAFLENSTGLWYPDDTSHAHSLSNEESEYIYLNTTYPFAPELYPIKPGSKFPALQKILYASTHDSKHQNYPIISQLFCPATYTFLLLLTTLLAFYHHKKYLALCTIPIWGIFVSLLFSAGIFIRYAYPLMTTVPLLFSLVFFSQQRE